MGASLVVMAAALLLAPATASATTSCTYTGAPFDLLQVALQGGDQLKLGTSGTAIVVNNGSTDLTCSGGNPTLSNTKTISVASQTGGTPNIAEIDGPARFGDAGIETFVNLHDVPGSALFVVATAAGGESIQYGSNGIGASTSGGDPAVTLTPNGVPRLEFFGGPGRDQITAQGGSVTGAPRTDPVHLRGGAGTDSLEGGDGDDTISGDDGSDTIFGNAGNDTIDPGAGDDAPVDGGDGTDALSFQDSPAGVQVDLALSNVRQNTGPEGSDAFARIENVIGSELNDDLRGDGGPNLLNGFTGNDAIEGRAGTDDLRGGANDDTILARDGEADAVDCGSEADTVTTDLPGVDTLAGCETALFLPVQNGGGTGPPSGGGTTTGTAGTGTTGPVGGPSQPPASVAVADTLAPSFLASPRAVPSRFLVDRRGPREVAVSGAARGTTFRYALSEAARVTFTIERKRPGRCGRAKRRCARFKRVAAFGAEGVAGPNAKRFSGRIGRRTLAPAAYRALVTATDAAGNRSVAATVRFTVLRG